MTVLKKEIQLTVKEKFLGDEKERNQHILQVLLEILETDKERWQS